MSSLEIEEKDPHTEQLNLAGTHLNLTAILTKLQKHTQAIKHAKSAIAILDKLIQEKEKHIESEKRVSFDENTFVKDGVVSMPVTIKDQDTLIHSDNIEKQNKMQQDKNLYLTEAIAYYNLGASYEHLVKTDEAIKSFQIASQIAKIHLGLNHPLTLTIDQNLQKVLDKQKMNTTSHMLRQMIRKQNAISNIFQNDARSLLSKRLKQQQNMNNTILNKELPDTTNPPLNQTINQTISNELKSISPKQEQFGVYQRSRIRMASMQNTKRKAMTRLNKTQANTNNNSLTNLNDFQKHQFNDIISNNDSQNNFILAISHKDDDNIFSNQSIRIGTQPIKSTQNSNIPPLNFKKRMMSIDYDQKQVNQPFYNFNNLLQSTENNYIPRKRRDLSIRKPNTAQINKRERLLNSSLKMNDTYGMDPKPIPNDRYAAVKQALEKTASISQQRKRIPIDNGSVIAERKQQENFNFLNKESSLSRLNKRLNTLESQVALKSQVK